MVAAVWIVAALGLVAWSLIAWGVYRLLVLDPGWVGDVAPLLDKVPFGDALDLWLPGWQQIARGAIEMTQVMLGWLGGAAPWIAGVVWALGAIGLLGSAALLTLIVRAVRRPAGAPPAAGAR